MTKIKNMLTRISFQIIALTMFLAFFSACEDEISTAPGEFQVLKVMPAKTYIGDTVTIYGNNLGMKNKTNLIFFTEKINLLSEECIAWNHSKIVFILPKGVQTGAFFVYKGEEKSKELHLTVDLLPGLKLIELSAGSFKMGSTQGVADELPQHVINITKPFIINKYEVSQRLYFLVCDTVPSKVKDYDLPVSNVSWLDAVIFCNKLSRVHNLDSAYIVKDAAVTLVENANGWRLPTEAEWEYACRAGKYTDFSGTGKLEEMGWYASNAGGKAQSVGLKKENDFKIHDMHGNLREWCWDLYDANYYSTSPSDDPKGGNIGDKRVLRGGCWNDGNTFVRSSCRRPADRDDTKNGIRIVRTK